MAALTGPNSPIAGLTTAQIASVLGITPVQAAALTSAQIAGEIFGDFTGTLHIRTPQNATGDGFAINPTLNGNIIDPSSIVVEGYQIYDVTQINGQLTNTDFNNGNATQIVTPGSNGIVKFTDANSARTFEGSVFANGQTFGNGTAALYSSASGLLAQNADVMANNANGKQLMAALEIVPGAEIINTATAAPDTYALKNGGGVTTTSTGASFYVPTGTAQGNDTVTSTVAYTVTSASGVVTSFKAGQTTSIAAGSTVILTGAGKLSFSSTNSSDSVKLDGVVPGLTIITTGSVVKTAATGNITLGTTSSDSFGDWDLSTFRYGPNNAPGVLTIRASNNLIFYNSLSDGFDGTAAFNANHGAGQPLYTAPLLAFNPLLPANAQSYSYNLTAGADFTSANGRGRSCRRRNCWARERAR